MRILYLLLFVQLFYSCATIVPPTGGDKDNSPPKLIKTKPLNNSINTFPKKISLVFDEYIDLKKGVENIIVSPSLYTKPSFKVNKNKLNVTLPTDSLKKNTTYNIKFINSISDINEGNVIKELNFSFSTGTVFDSQNFICKCFNNYNNKTIPNCKGTLINKNNKSLYYSTSYNDGILKFNNLSQDSFIFTAFTDLNKNNVLDFNEYYFYKEFFLNPKQDFENIYLIKNIPKDTLKLMVSEASYVDQNTISLKFNRSINLKDKISYSLNNFFNKKENDLISTKNKDSFLIYYSFNERDSLILKIKLNDFFQSFKIKQSKNREKKQLQLELKTPLVTKDIPIIFKTNIPILLINSELIFINGKKTEKDIQVSKNSSLIINNFNNYPVEIIFKKGSITDINGISEFSDTFKINQTKANETGNISFNITDSLINLNTNLLITIYNENYKYNITSTLGEKIRINNLLPGSYDLEIVLDENKNGIADEGNYFEGIIPERIIRFDKFFNVKPNWDIENVNINLN